MLSIITSISYNVNHVYNLINSESFSFQRKGKEASCDIYIYIFVVKILSDSTQTNAAYKRIFHREMGRKMEDILYKPSCMDNTACNSYNALSRY